MFAILANKQKEMVDCVQDRKKWNKKKMGVRD